MGPEGAVVVSAVAAVLTPLICLTALGERRRGGGWLVAVAAGFFFPVAWTVWYVHDERSGRAAR